MRSLLESWDSVAKRMAGRPVVLFLDFDGTLCPIVAEPSRAALPPGVRRLLRRLAAAPGVEIVVVSGRSLRDVTARLGVPGVTRAGNYGLEIAGPALRRVSFATRGHARALASVKTDLAAALRPLRGVIVEDKGLSISVHYRMAAAGERSAARRLVRETLAARLARGAVRIRRGKMVTEVLPPVEWDKGKAVLWFLARRREAHGGGRPLPLYIGDDAADADAFRALGNAGITVSVGAGRRPGARYRLRGPGEVAEFLERLLAERRRKP